MSYREMIRAADRELQSRRAAIRTLTNLANARALDATEARRLAKLISERDDLEERLEELEELQAADDAAAKMAKKWAPKNGTFRE